MSAWWAMALGHALITALLLYELETYGGRRDEL